MVRSKSLIAAPIVLNILAMHKVVCHSRYAVAIPQIDVVSRTVPCGQFGRLVWELVQ